MLKSKKFAIQREDEDDFEMFLQKLNQKRQQDIGGFLEEERKTSSPTKLPTATAVQDSYRGEEDEYNLTKITERSKDEEPSTGRVAL